MDGAERKLRGAIVGLGRMGLTHLAILRSHPEVAELALVEASACLGRAVGTQLGLSWYSTMDELLAGGSPDFLVVATPTRFHYQVASAAIDERIPVFIEKPLSLSPNESRMLARAAAEQQVVAQVGYVNRFNEIFVAVRNLLRSGDLGYLTHVSCEIRSPMVMKTTDSSWRSKDSEGGGSLNDIAAHGIDLLNYIAGPPQEVIGSSMQSLVSRQVEDRVEVLFGYRGFTGSLHVNWSDPSCRKPAYRLVVDAQRGRIIADQHAYKVFRTFSVAGRQANSWQTVYITDIAQPVRMYVRGNEFTRQLDHFIACLGDDRLEPVNTLESALETDEVIERIRRSAKIVRPQ